MSDTSQQEAAEHAEQAAAQAKAAAKNAGRAVKDASEVVADEAKETAEKLEGTAQDAANAVKKVNVPGFLMDASIGFGALSLSVFFGAGAIQAFRNAAKNLKP